MGFQSHNHKQLRDTLYLWKNPRTVKIKRFQKPTQEGRLLMSTHHLIWISLTTDALVLVIWQFYNVCDT